MRAFTLVSFGLILTLAGCGTHECASRTETDAKSTDAECKSDDCCSNLSRTALLTKSVENAAPGAVRLKTTKFDAFTKEVAAQNGKVVCAYLWSEAHAASKKNLPILLALQRKFEKDGVVCLTVSNDPAKATTKTVKALEDAQCNLANYQQAADDAIEGWAGTFGCCGFPALVVFGRDGKKAATFDVTELPFDPAVIEQTVTKLLAAK